MSKDTISERFRPKTLEEVVGQDEVIESIKNKKELNDMMFIGPPGSGKTTVAHILAKIHNLPIEELNASDENGIEVIRNEVKAKAMHKVKFIYLLDEADMLSSNAQTALRRTMEKSNAIFILTGNYEYKFLDPIVSRCSVYPFKPLTTRHVLMQIIKICKAEEIQFDNSESIKDGLKELAHRSGGDMRKAINMLETIIDKNNEITVKSVRELLKPNQAKLILNKAMEGDLENSQTLLEKEIKENRTNPSLIIEGLYEAVKEIKDNSIRARLYYDLRKTAMACQVKSNPITPVIHIIGFLSYAWILPHLPSNCPAMNRGD